MAMRGLSHRRSGPGQPSHSGTVRYWLLRAALWLAAALTLAAIGHGIARTLESSLLGFLGADFVFLIAMSIYLAGPGRTPGRRY